MIDYSTIGLSILPDFITDEEEQTLLANIGAIEVKKLPKGRSKIIRFGSEKPYDNFVKSPTIPDYLVLIAKKLLDAKLLDEMPDHVSINEYLPGGFIPKHVDSRESGQVITVLSLLSDAEMVFQKGNEKFTVQLPRKCLVQMKGEARWQYTHAIEKINETRYSIVFRNSKA